jgi:hypothetical protein
MDTLRSARDAVRSPWQGEDTSSPGLDPTRRRHLQWAHLQNPHPTRTVKHLLLVRALAVAFSRAARRISRPLTPFNGTAVRLAAKLFGNGAIGDVSRFGATLRGAKNVAAPRHAGAESGCMRTHKPREGRHPHPLPRPAWVNTTPSLVVFFHVPAPGATNPSRSARVLPCSNSVALLVVRLYVASWCARPDGKRARSANASHNVPTPAQSPI